MKDESPARGRGAGSNPANRFDNRGVVPDREQFDEEGPSPATQFLRDSARTIIANNDSPDVGFDFSVNPYRGCENGCVYCYARPTHEYLGFSAGLDFETRILVKEDAPALLRRELSAKSWRPQTISMSGVTDPYQPVERKLEVTRRCLEVLAEFRNPVCVITKRDMVARDADLLAELASFGAAAVLLSITTLDPELARKLEPRASAPARRLGAVEQLARAGVPVGVMAAPMIPGLTDHEMPAILAAAAAAGARFAGFTPVRLPGAVAPLFEQWLEEHYPTRKEKVLNRIRSIRGGGLNDSRFATRMRGEGVFADGMRSLFNVARRKAGIDGPWPELSTDAFRVPSGPQLSLFE